ncbi:MAG: ribosome small subunit-dependent GTPase A [Balneolaceae bacterium]
MNLEGRIIQSTGKWVKVDTGKEVIDCRIPGKFRLQGAEVTNPVAVGDLVEIEHLEEGTGMIRTISERKNYLPREATHGRRGEQILASNIDLAWVVQSVRNPKLKSGFIDRLLIAAEAYDLPAGIIINKLDLAKKSDLSWLEELRKLYTGLGYPFLTVSALESESLEEITETLNGGTGVLVGPSGSGKSTLLNALVPGLNQPVGEVSVSSKKGIHTTTFTRLVQLPVSGYIADTPGIRELGLVNISPPELSLYYPEMREVRQQCRFYNCTHSHEPLCGVVAAFEAGKIHPERYHNYLNILESLEGADGNISN